MSTLQVEICQVLEVKNHPNGDRLDIIKVKGWDSIVKRDQFKVGDWVIFIPPDSIVPKKLHEHLKITNYCAELPKSSQDAIDGKRRVKAARLRGVPSYGTVMTKEDVCTLLSSDIHKVVSVDGLNWSNLAQILNITKYEPPIRSTQGDVERDSPQFHKYTDIENWRNYPNVFQDSEYVVISEKIHGTNCRIGYCLDTLDGQWKFMAGSHRTRRSEGLYWFPFNWYPQLKDMILEIHERNDKKPVVVFGEIFGLGVQDLHYGITNKDFKIFDISVDSHYIDYPYMNDYCKIHNIPIVPILYIGPYSADKVKELTDGPAFNVADDAKFKGREGCVIKSYIETNDYDIGRKILKSVSADYLDRKGAQDNE